MWKTVKAFSTDKQVKKTLRLWKRVKFHWKSWHNMEKGGMVVEANRKY